MTVHERLWTRSWFIKTRNGSRKAKRPHPIGLGGSSVLKRSRDALSRWLDYHDLLFL